MVPNPALGVLFHWLGGLASGSFYVPFRGVKKWSWETYWLVGGFFSWIIAPWILASIMTSDLPEVLRQAPSSTIMWCYFFGMLWGLGGLTFGLTMRYLGMSLGMAVALGYCAAFGTLMPPIFRRRVLHQGARHAVGAGDPVRRGDLPGGHRLRGHGGHVERREMPEEQKQAVDQGIQPEEGDSGRNVLGRHERLLLLRAGCRAIRSR